MISRITAQPFNSDFPFKCFQSLYCLSTGCRCPCRHPQCQAAFKHSVRHSWFDVAACRGANHALKCDLTLWQIWFDSAECLNWAAAVKIRFESPFKLQDTTFGSQTSHAVCTFFSKHRLTRRISGCVKNISLSFKRFPFVLIMLNFNANHLFGSFQSIILRLTCQTR